MAKELDIPEDNQGWEDLIVQGKTATANTNSNTTTKTDTIPKTKLIINNKPSTKNSTKRSTKPSNNTNTVIVKEKVKYVDTKTQRAYWFDNDLIEVFAREYPKERFDNSAIMNQLLRNFLIENGKL